MWIELDLYSGRPNPGWSLTADEADELAARLDALPVDATRPAPDGPDDAPLGYRGLRIAGPAGLVRVGGGRVIAPDGRGRASGRIDSGRALERWLLDTAAGRLDDALRRFALDSIGGAPFAR